MIDDILFSDAGREEVARVAEMCLLAGRGDLIPELIRKGASLDDCRRLFAATANAQGGNPRAPSRTPAPPASGPLPSSAPSWSDLQRANAEQLVAYQRGG